MNISICAFMVLFLAIYFNTKSLAVDAVLEIREDENGNPIWENGEYRNRNEVPLPPNYDARRKHRSITESKESDNEGSYNKSKKNTIRTSKRKGKKSSIPSEYLRNKNSETGKLNMPGSISYTKLHLDNTGRRSNVPRTWGTPYGALFPKAPKDITGDMRSTLQSGYKITEEDLESGMMFRGLGGLKERAQNENLIEGLFQDKEDEEQEHELAKDQISSRRM